MRIAASSAFNCPGGDVDDRLADSRPGDVGCGVVENQPPLPGIFKDGLHQTEFVIEPGSRKVCASLQDPSLAMSRADMAQGDSVEKRFEPSMYCVLRCAVPADI